MEPHVERDALLRRFPLADAALKPRQDQRVSDFATQGFRYNAGPSLDKIRNLSRLRRIPFRRDGGREVLRASDRGASLRKSSSNTA